MPLSDSNRVRIAVGLDPTPRVALSSARARTLRATGEQLVYVPKYVKSKELRSDRMSQDPILVNTSHSGPLNTELSYPVDGSALSVLWQSLFFNTWTNTPFRDNDGVSASAITSVTTGTNVIAITSGSTIQTAHLVRNTGFGQAANNGIFRCTTGSATAPAFTGAGFVTEASPPAAARMKVVGLQGVAADIAATATGLTSATLNWATLGIVPGMWIKMGGSAVATQFANAANNAQARVAAIPATGTLTLDNLPAGWAADAGTGKTITIFFGDRLINGVNQLQYYVERAFLDHSPIDYILQRGFSADTANFNVPEEDIMTVSFGGTGQRGADSATTPISTYDAAPDSSTYPAFAGNVHITRLSEAGSVIAAPNWLKSASFSIKNNVRALTALGNVGAVDVGAGSFDVTGTFNFYFGNRAFITKLFAGTPSAFNMWTQSAISGGANHAVNLSIPRLFYTGGNPSASGIDQDVMAPMEFMTSRDPVTNCELDLQRFEYLE